MFQHENTIVTQDGQQIQVAMRVTAPDVVLLDNFMTHDECDAFCELSKSTLTKSTVVDDATGAHVGHEHRTSMGTYFTLGQNDLVKKIEARIAEITGTPVPNGEGIQILNYAGGGEYRPHFDYFPDNTGGRVHTAKGGQRTITVIMYLNDVKAGGATVLPDINLSVYPKRDLRCTFRTSIQRVKLIRQHCMEGHPSLMVRNGLQQSGYVSGFTLSTYPFKNHFKSLFQPVARQYIQRCSPAV